MKMTDQGSLQQQEWREASLDLMYEAEDEISTRRIQQERDMKILGGGLTVAELPAESVTVRALCRTCNKQRLHRCDRVAVIAGNSVVCATCLTCLSKTTG